MGTLLAAMLMVAASEEPLPSVAVLELAPKTGVGPDVASLLTDHLTAILRRSGRFRRVTSLAEVVATLEAERRKMVVDCDRQSCLPEIGGALGVDLLVFGSVGRVGTVWIISMRMVDARTAAARGSASRPAEGTDPAVLVRVVEEAAAEMLGSPEPAAATPAPRGRPSARARTLHRNPELTLATKSALCRGAGSGWHPH